MSQASTAAPQTFFSRKATGLVREMSVRDAAIFNVLPAVPGAVIAYFLLWGLSAFPGADLILDMIIVGVFSTLLALSFGFLSVAMPRSGADYILNSRTLHPALGLAGSVTLMISGLLSIGYWSLWTIQGGVGPTLIQIGASLNNNSTLQSWGSTLSASNAPTFILALALVLATTWALLSGLRLVMRIQLWLFVVAMGGFILTIILSSSRATTRSCPGSTRGRSSTPASLTRTTTSCSRRPRTATRSTASTTGR